MSRLSQLIESARRKSLQLPGQLEIPDDDLTIADIEDDELWQEHTRKRMKLPLFDSGNPNLGDEISALFGSGCLWATADEALQEFRARTYGPTDLRYLFGSRLDHSFSDGGRSDAQRSYGG